MLLILLIPLALAGLVLSGALRLPPAWDPFAPLDLKAAPNPLTRWKLARMEWQPEACFAAFAASGLSVARLPGRASGEGCTVEDALRLGGTPALSPPAPMATCPLAAAWTIYAGQVLQPAAERHLGQPVVRVRQLGTYACRDVRGGTRRSQHATANAIDVAGFTLADGREVSLARDWDDPGPRGAFLRDARDGACRLFDAVLGPDYNAAHRDHFHLDRGPWRTCR
ncbi:extensin family protein [Roseomonas sp. OT10]|uniref:extensin-like domain-containing protein n=1 Tax=Roseomonas cutis TaxID=2897332 RepID=UPI001E3AB12A|nr:extensin family protein [Roseomonas sp. OT10]UFN47593.1 extensin family protein [Roseomonas sp. OT10]